jgi:hypothetical protein
MISPLESQDNKDVPKQFIEMARAAYSDGKPFIFDVNKIILISNDSALRLEFRRLFFELNDMDLRGYITEYLGEVPDRLEIQADRAENSVGLIDQAGMTVASATAVAGLMAILTVGVTVGAVFLLAGGMVSLAIGGVGRFLVKSRASQRKADSKHVKRFLNSLRKQES